MKITLTNGTTIEGAPKELDEFFKLKNQTQGINVEMNKLIQEIEIVLKNAGMARFI